VSWAHTPVVLIHTNKRAFSVAAPCPETTQVGDEARDDLGEPHVETPVPFLKSVLTAYKNSFPFSALPSPDLMLND
jgi:hypothetical protein